MQVFLEDWRALRLDARLPRYSLFEVRLMRMIRRLPLGLALVALLPAVGFAQTEKPFTDAWLWGLKAGALSYSTTQIENGFAPTVGVEWLITRKKGGLYVSLDRSFFNEESSVFDNQSVVGQRMVSVRDLQRVSVAALAFPKQYDNLRPYAGIGIGLNFIGSARPTGEFANSSHQNYMQAVVEDERSRASLLAMGGLQMDLDRFSTFGQITVLPFQSNFLLNGRSAFAIDFGVRLNIGSSIDYVK